MGSFGGFYSGDKKKQKKSKLEDRARKISYQQPFVLPKVEILTKKKKDENNF